MPETLLESEAETSRAYPLPAALALSSANEPELNWKALILCLLLILLAAGGGLWYWSDKKANETADLYFAQATDAMLKGDNALATAKLNMAIKEKNRGIFFLAKYKLLLGEGNDYEAELMLSQALRRESRNAVYAFEAAKFYAGREEPEKSLAAMKKAVALDPRNSEYRLEYGIKLFLNGHREEGEKLMETLLKEDPEYYEIWDGLATLYGEKGDYKKAIETRLKAVRKYPEDAFHWFWLANTYDLRNEKAKAVAAYRKSIELDPESGAHAAMRIAALTGKPVQEKYREIIQDSIPVSFENTHAMVQVTVEGYPGKFLLDTGATDSIVYEHFLKNNGLEKGDNPPTGQYETAGGMISVPVLYADFKVGRFPVSNVRVGILPDEGRQTDIDGILGMNVLRHFNVKMDNLKERLIFSRR